jgi:hypothetical protein
VITDNDGVWEDSLEGRILCEVLTEDIQ